MKENNADYGQKKANFTGELGLIFLFHFISCLDKPKATQTKNVPVKISSFLFVLFRVFTIWRIKAYTCAFFYCHIYLFCITLKIKGKLGSNFKKPELEHGRNQNDTFTN